MKTFSTLTSITATFGATILLSAASATTGTDEAQDKAKSLLDHFAAKVGTYSDLQAKHDVEYTYHYRDNVTGTSDISIERYLFDGELSWAKYTTHEKNVFPGEAGVPIQGFDGKHAWTTLDGKLVTTKEALGLASFLRKTNFYWFAMMQKLQDPGTIHTHAGTREHNGISYDLVKLEFEAPEGSTSDTYLLYVNPKTKLIDQFLFTVVDFGVTENPLLMRVPEYKKFGKIMLPVTRKYTQSDWDGNITADAVWTDEIMTKIKFGNEFTPADFAAPVL